MGWSNMGKDFRHPVLPVSRDDSQVVAEIHAELLDAVSERLDQCRIACVKLGLIEAEYEWPIVGSPRGRLTQLEKAFVTKPWEDVRESVRVKLIEHGEETYVFVRSEGRRDKEQSMRRRRLKKLLKRLRELQQQNLTRDELLLKLGAARKEAGKAYALLIVHMPTKDQPVTSETFHFALDRNKLRQARRREGGYLLRSNIKSDDPGYLWRLYLQLVEVEHRAVFAPDGGRILTASHDNTARLWDRDG